MYVYLKKRLQIDSNFLKINLVVDLVYILHISPTLFFFQNSLYASTEDIVYSKRFLHSIAIGVIVNFSHQSDWEKNLPLFQRGDKWLWGHASTKKYFFKKGQ